MKLPNHSPAAQARFPAPVREHYFTGADYAAACQRTHDKRVKRDGTKSLMSVVRVGGPRI